MKKITFIIQIGFFSCLNTHGVLSVGVDNHLIFFSGGHDQDGVRLHVKVFLTANVHPAPEGLNL